MQEHFPGFLLSEITSITIADSLLLKLYNLQVLPTYCIGTKVIEFSITLLKLYHIRFFP